MKYPKIQTLWKRDENDKYNIMPGQHSLDEFRHWNRWHVTEKIDGTNIRVMLTDGVVEFRGRTDKAQLYAPLVKYLQDTFTQEIMGEAFPEDDVSVILYGEGYGPRVQRHGELYSDDVGFVLFDVWINGWWLKQEDVTEMALKLGVPRAPEIGVMDAGAAEWLVAEGFPSKFAKYEKEAEGVEARSDPLVLLRNGKPLMWKLKTQDFVRLNNAKQ